MKFMSITLIAALAATSISTSVEAGPRDRLDRIEDRIDRRENYIDRQTDNGRWDRIEDVVDRREDWLDRHGYERTPRINRHERRSWRRLWGNN